MNPEAKKRRKIARQIRDQIKDTITSGLIMVGSTAYAPDAVTEHSDLDLVAVTQFRRTPFEQLYDAVRHPFEPELVQYAQQEMFDNFSLVFEREGIKVGLHIWDNEALISAINLERNQKRFVRPTYHSKLTSSAPQETLRNLEGIEKTLERTPLANFPGGKIQPLFICYENLTGMYLGIPATNLLLEPKVLCDTTEYVSDGIAHFRRILRRKVDRCYDTLSEKSSVYNSLPERIQKKISPKLRKKLILLLE